MSLNGAVVEKLEMEHHVDPHSVVRQVERTDDGRWVENDLDYDHLIELAHDSQTFIAFCDWNKYLSNESDIQNRLSRAFSIPSIFWHEHSHRSNGFFSSNERVEDGQKCHRSWFRFETKRVFEFHVTGSSKYEWVQLTFFTQFREPGSMAILCLDTPLDLQGALLRAAKKVPIPTCFEDLYGWHCEIVDEVVTAFDEAVWTIRDVVRNFEKQRPTDFSKDVDFDLLHESARHVVHSSESVGVAIDIVESMLKQHCSLAELSDVFLPEALNDPARLKRKMSHRQVTTRLEGHVLALRALRHRATSNEARLKNEIALAFNTVAQRDSVSMIELSETSTSDSQAMRRISFVTLLLLPATAVSTMFSSAFFNFQPPSSNGKTNISPDFWIFWVITVPLTGIVYAFWWYAERRYADAVRKKIDLARRSTRMTRESTGRA